ncbi:hypothetical protein [Congregibacter litoralis]|uniref:hypothetical protein n=1 Tax=Congregibacter litoralis TaxID=393662 RepID=UPI000326C61B|nr:hypothetical protein [Congregibacter litoralis]
MSITIERRGVWLYDGVAKKPVDIINLPYDWWYSLAKADDMLEPDEEPEPLNEHGVLYYVRFRNAGESQEPTWVDSQGFQNINEAIAAAESKVTGGIQWQNT